MASDVAEYVAGASVAGLHRKSGRGVAGRGAHGTARASLQSSRERSKTRLSGGGNAITSATQV